jgi:hypothetical protein
MPSLIYVRTGVLILRIAVYLSKIIFFGLVAAVLTGCTAPTAEPVPTPRPTVTILNACDVIDESEITMLVGEPMTVFDEVHAGETTDAVSFTSRCEFAGWDPVSEARVILSVYQPKPGLEVLPIEEIAQRYISGMQSAGITQYEPLTELGPAAFWLPETQTTTVFQEDGTGVTVSVAPSSENARAVANQIIERTLNELGY